MAMQSNIQPHLQPLTQPLAQSQVQPLGQSLMQPLAQSHMQPLTQSHMQPHTQPQAHMQPLPQPQPHVQQQLHMQPLSLVPQPKGQPVQNFFRGDRHLFSTSDDTVMMKQVQATHAPDGREVDVKPLLNVIEDIFNRSTPGIDGLVHPTSQAQIDAFEDKTQHVDFVGMLEALAYTIHKISCEISCKCSGGGDVHATTLAVFNTLSNYSWDAKLVLALAAFGVNYGEFWLVAHLYPTNPLAKSIALLKQLPDLLEHNELLRPRFEGLKNLIKEMLDVTKCIVDFKELPPQYINYETPVMAAALTHIPTAVYWVIRSVVACSAQIISLIGLGHEYMTTTTETSWDLSSLGHKVNNIHGHLRKQLALCYQHIDGKRHLEAYQTLVRLFETIHIDNMKILRALIYAHEDILPLYDGSTKKRVNLEVLRRKNVLLLISDLDILHEELSILDQMYRESRHQPNRPESSYEVVWLPVVDRSTPWTDEKQKQFETLQFMMPWYSVHHPSVLDPAVIKYIKEVWKFAKKPILVVLDPQGRVANQNAVHMMWIWGSLAFPFTSTREDALWKEESWRLELLVDGIDQNILNWIGENRLICLYGGEDMEWIRKLTLAARAVSAAIRTPIEMVYVGKSNPKERVRKNNSIIGAEKLSHFWPDLTSIWFFWVRLESMWYSKMQHGKTVENDPIMQEIMTMLSFDGSEQGWAVISKGSAEMAKAKGETILTSFTEIEQWKEHVEPKGFVPALTDHLHQLHTPHHCNRLILPGTTGSIPEMVVCAECGRAMEKFVMYRCCND
ncbi:Sieve element occlusion b [Thalictrum thalictroides]|uniref:Sieve element occlusion b n=1 Tax=Thalictrum thalictroides TaxID=46969 RepID=A0A7J6WKX4_THATH|nr:Sieve element occlusion b [Thalictrum thalictroides]